MRWCRLLALSVVFCLIAGLSLAQSDPNGALFPADETDRSFAAEYLTLDLPDRPDQTASAIVSLYGFRNYAVASLLANTGLTCEQAQFWTRIDEQILPWDAIDCAADTPVFRNFANTLYWVTPRAGEIATDTEMLPPGALYRLGSSGDGRFTVVVLADMTPENPFGIWDAQTTSTLDLSVLLTSFELLDFDWLPNSHHLTILGKYRFSEEYLLLSLDAEAETIETWFSSASPAFEFTHLRWNSAGTLLYISIEEFFSDEQSVLVYDPITQAMQPGDIDTRVSRNLFVGERNALP